MVTLPHPFRRILIANRGEIAVRLIRACRELGLSPVAVFSEADAHALHVRLADTAVPLGPAPAAHSYLRGDAIIAAAQASGAEAIHPGYGFLSENPAFALACEAAGLIFIGPPPAAIEAMGGKIGARQLAQSVGVPVVPGYDGEDQRLNTLRKEAERIGYPLLIKASAGGGGKGMRSVFHPHEFAEALAGARREAHAAFGDETVFLERLIQRPRHIEIQIIADNYGHVVALGERECSIQRRHQKIVEEAPSPALTPELRHAMGAAAVRIAGAAHYVNAGTIEFVLDPQGQFYFLEMNTRLQVEHPVTELITGLDLVHLQIAIAMGAALPFTQAEVQLRGHAIEVRLYAEDPATFLPAIGRLALFDHPGGPGVRVDSGLTTGDEVTVYYDPMIAKIIVAGHDRAAAIGRLRRVLDECAVLGLTTNLPLLRAIAAHPAFAAGATHTGFLSEHQLAIAPPHALPPPVLLAAAIWHLVAQPGTPRPDPFAQLWRAHQAGVPLRLRWGRLDYQLQAELTSDGWQIAVDGRDHYRVRVVAQEPHGLTLAIDATGSERFRIAHDQASGELLVQAQGVGYCIGQPVPLSAEVVERHGSPHGSESLSAPMPGTLINVLISEGEAVVEGQPLLVLEAMKMEHTIRAPHAGIVRRVPYGAGASVAGGAVLVELEGGE